MAVGTRSWRVIYSGFVQARDLHPGLISQIMFRFGPGSGLVKIIVVRCYIGVFSGNSLFEKKTNHDNRYELK